MSLYTYEPLDPTTDAQKVSARIIRLMPSLDVQAELECELLHIILATEDRPQYEAISYTWGGQEASEVHYILCRCKDNTMRRLHITENAEASLRHLRLEHTHRFLWLDSVCIDQSCMAERNFQVQNMGYIYTFAERVVVWLGKSVTQGSKLALEYMRQIAELNLDDDNDTSRLHELCVQIRKGQKETLNPD